MDKEQFLKELLNDGEVYAGAIVNPDGTGHHIILLPGDINEINWKAAMELAKTLGGDLPDRVEQALFYKHLRGQFQPDWYWSGEQHAVNSDYAWDQDFSNGVQISGHKSWEGRARAVRRVIIGEQK